MERIVGEFVEGIRLHGGDLSSYDDNLLTDGETEGIVEDRVLPSTETQPLEELHDLN